MTFQNKDDLKRFAKRLKDKLESIGENSLANQLHEWDEEFFTTTSELLGEMRLILEKTQHLRSLDEVTKREVKDCIAAINKAFEQ